MGLLTTQLILSIALDDGDFPGTDLRRGVSSDVAPRFLVLMSNLKKIIIIKKLKYTFWLLLISLKKVYRGNVVGLRFSTILQRGLALLVRPHEQLSLVSSEDSAGPPWHIIPLPIITC